MIALANDLGTHADAKRTRLSASPKLIHVYHLFAKEEDTQLAYQIYSSAILPFETIF